MVFLLRLRPWFQRTFEFSRRVNIGLSPETNDIFPYRERLWCSDLPALNPRMKRLARDSDLRCCFGRRVVLAAHHHHQFLQTFDAASSNC